MSKTRAPPFRAPIAARCGPNATVVDVEDGPLLRLDAEGRWTGLKDGALRVRRTVQGTILQVVGGGFREVRAASVDGVQRRAAELAAELAETLASAGPEQASFIGARQEVVRKLTTASEWTPERHRAERERFAAAYPEPIPILPPHRYRDMVVLPALGCPNHSCSFCEFYRDRRFAVLDDAAFEAHLQAVLGLFGAAAAERGGVFLGSGAALAVPDKVLVPRLMRIREATAAAVGALPRRVAAFHDPDRGKARSVAQWRVLKEAGLVDVTVGLETGLPELRKAAGKSDDLGRFEDCVAAMRQAEVAVAVTVLVGLGGERARVEHRDRTVSALAGLPLSAADRIYLSPLAGSMAEDALRAETRAFRAALKGRTGAKVGAYLVRRFAYFA